MEEANFIDAARAALNKVSDLELTIPTSSDEQIVPQEFYDEFFKLQVNIEGEGAMDYRKYAFVLWERVFGSEPDLEDAIYREFEGNIILGLHQIDMNVLVYPHVKDSMHQLVEALVEKARKVILWSTGDTESTGYQVRKINRSKVIHKFLLALAEVIPDKETRKKFMKEQTVYMVEGNKIEELEKYFVKEGADIKKVVLIEDSRSNMDKVAALVDGLEDVEYFPIWTLYSRSGMKARGADGFDSLKKQYSGIDSFEDLLGDDYLSAADGADVIIDFDGVLGDHVCMRNMQAQVKWLALKNAADKKGVSLELN